MSDVLSSATLWSEIDWVVYRTAAAVLLGAVVGMEREFRDKPAGLRTLILISVGACVFSTVLAADWRAIAPRGPDRAFPPLRTMGADPFDAAQAGIDWLLPAVCD